MGRIRTIKPEFWTDEKVGELKRDERLLFLGLLNLADDEGVLKATPAFIKGQIFAYDEDLSIADVRTWIEALISKKMLIPFEYNSEKFLLVRTFKAHQKINRPTPSKIPKNILESILNADSVNAHGGLTEDSLPEGKGKEREEEIEQGMEGDREGGSLTPQVDENLLEKTMRYFNFNEVANFDKFRDTSDFLKCIAIADKLKYFEDQMDAYFEYKKITNGTAFIHSFSKFLGSASKLFTDGAWNQENWAAKLEIEKSKLGHHNTQLSKFEKLQKSYNEVVNPYLPKP
jgi:hypothetical protein